MSKSFQGTEVPGGEPSEVVARLLDAAVRVVALRETSEVTLDEIAGAAGVDAGEASENFVSVNDLLIEAALRIARDDLRLDVIARSLGAPTVSAYAQHFAKRRAFYRAMRTGAVAERLDARMAAVVAPLIAVQIHTVVGGRMSAEALATMTAEVTVEVFTVTNRWIVESAESAGAEDLYVLFEGVVLRRLDEVRSLTD